MGDLGSIPWWGRSPGERKGYPLQYPGLENSVDCIARGVTKSWTWLSDFHFQGHIKIKDIQSQFSSVQFSRSVESNSLPPHESQHARPPCPSPTPGVHSDSHPSSQWCHPAISSSVIPFSTCPQSLPASESFPTSQLFAWGSQSIGVSALASFFPKKSQGSFRMDWLDLLAVQGTLKSLIQHHRHTEHCCCYCC